MRALFGKTDGNGLANAAARADDNSNFIRQMQLAYGSSSFVNSPHPQPLSRRAYLYP
jgi:hypothetical protein